MVLRGRVQTHAYQKAVPCVLSFLSWRSEGHGRKKGSRRGKRYLQIRLTFLGLCWSPYQACSYLQNTSQIGEFDLGTAGINADRIILRTCAEPPEGWSTRTNGRSALECSSTSPHAFNQRDKGALVIPNISVLKDTLRRCARVRSGVIKEHKSSPPYSHRCHFHSSGRRGSYLWC